MGRLTTTSLCFWAISASVVAAPPSVALIEDDFSRYPPGLLSQPIGQLNPAIQEYHYLAHRGVPLTPWANAIGYLDAWLAGDEEGGPYLEQHLPHEGSKYMEPPLFSPQFITGDPEWGEYTVATSVRPLFTEGSAGIVFRYRTNRHHYQFALEDGKRVRLAVRQPLEKKFCVADWRELAIADFAYTTDRYYRLRVEDEGPKIRAFVDDRLIFAAEDVEILRGKVGVAATTPARFQAFSAHVAPEKKSAIDERIAARESQLAKLRDENPRPKLVRKFETPKFGAGRNVRFGDLDGDGQLDMLIGQMVAKVDSGNFVELSCLTAVRLDGTVLWQIGRPNPQNGLLTSDTPFQIHDLEADGKAEVVLVKDFKLQVLDGRTGKPLRSVAMPKLADAADQNRWEIKLRPHQLNIGDSIAFCDLAGGGHRGDILLKDRYREFWLFDQHLKQKWSGGGMLGHYPYPKDVDGDGRDEIYIGYSKWNADGQLQWSCDDQLRDHADAVFVGNLSEDAKRPPLHYYSCSDDGFVLIDERGVLRRHTRIGHAQTAAVGKFDPELAGLQYMCINFWKNPGIVSLFEWQGNLMRQAEPIHSGSPLLPVNWRGDGVEFVLLSTNVQEGGMIDGQMRRVVMFPDDDHPDLCCAVLDLQNDPRDEIITWDQGRVWIYTPEGSPPADRVYAPHRNPHYNDSNYRTSVSLPGWK